MMVLRQLYRQYLRQIRQLPVLYLRQIFRLKARDDMRAMARTREPALLDSKLRRVRRDMRKVEAANKMNVKAFAHVLDQAYGRKGKLKWELLEPLLSDPCTHPTPAIIPFVRHCIPPMFSPELRALLTSALSRTTKPLRPGALDRPPTLPARAEPTSEEAMLFGAFSRRREVNVRWRYFAAESRKVLPPLYRKGDPNDEGLAASSGTVKDRRLQSIHVLEDIETLVGPLEKRKSLTRKELKSKRTVQFQLVTSTGYHPSRWLRRRYQQLLLRMPLLNYTLCHDSKSGYSQKVIMVTLSSRASRSSLRPSIDHLPQATATEMHWLNAGNTGCSKQNE